MNYDARLPGEAAALCAWENVERSCSKFVIQLIFKFVSFSQCLLSFYLCVSSVFHDCFEL